MEKQIFNIPDGCKIISVEQVGNQIITTFEPEKYVPKVGDCVKMNLNQGGIALFQIVEFDKDVNFCESGKAVIIENQVDFNRYEFGFTKNDYYSITKITPEELQAEFNKLGYHYDFETHTATKMRWKPEMGDDYYCVDDCGEICDCTSTDHCIDLDRYNFGNCFKTKEEAEAFRDYIKKYQP